MSHHGTFFCTDSNFGATFDGCFEEINFKSPSAVSILNLFSTLPEKSFSCVVSGCDHQHFGLFQADVSSYLQLLCLAENMRTDTKDLSCLLDWNRCDVRQSLLHLQFWACSGGGQQVHRPSPSSGKDIIDWKKLTENSWLYITICEYTYQKLLVSHCRAQRGRQE